MALRTPPSWLQNGSYPAESDRLTTQALYNTTGIIGANSMAVTANSPVGMSVRVASGWAAIVGTTQSNMGTYVAYNDATDVLTITTANPTNPRIDRVVATVNDAYYTGSSNNVVFQVIAGTPAGSPVAPATPANSISLATIAVAAAATQINSGNITDTRVQTTTNLKVAQPIQIVQSTYAPTVSNSTATLTDTGLTATITPSSASSKILVLYFHSWDKTVNNALNAVFIELQRGSTALCNSSLLGYSNTTALALFGSHHQSYLDSPATTSPVTYKTQMRNILAATAASTSNGIMILMEVAP